MVLPEEEYDPKRALRAAKLRRPDPVLAPFSFSIREATVKDMPDCRAIYNHYVENSTVTFDEEPLTQAQMRTKFQHVEQEGNPWLVAVSQSGEVLGYAYAGQYRDRSAYRHTVEDAIYLAPAATGKGIGKALLAELVRHAKAAGRKELVAVIADRGAEASIALHAKLGFKEVGRMGRVGFKFGRWLGTIYLQKHLVVRKKRSLFGRRGS